MTAKMLAQKLNLSAAAVSMALNNKPGVSEETREKVLLAAEKYGFDLSKHANKRHEGAICFVLYKKHGAVVGDTLFFSELTEGVEAGCKEVGRKMKIHYVHKADGITRQMADIVHADCSGIVLLGTEMSEDDYASFADLRVPMVLFDVYFNSAKHDCIQINNNQGAFIATNYLISRIQKQPGYLRSSYWISNFGERADGFYKAIRENGMSTSRCIVHRLAPNVEGAYQDMLALLENGEEIASGYFADNDLIAIGAKKAFQQKGIKIPEEVSIIGFDDISFANVVEPPLTTINVPKRFMGMVAVKQLAQIMQNREAPVVKIEVGVRLVKRKSTV